MTPLIMRILLLAGLALAALAASRRDAELPAAHAASGVAEAIAGPAESAEDADHLTVDVERLLNCEVRARVRVGQPQRLGRLSGLLLDRATGRSRGVLIAIDAGADPVERRIDLRRASWNGGTETLTLPLAAGVFADLPAFDDRRLEPATVLVRDAGALRPFGELTFDGLVSTAD